MPFLAAATCTKGLSHFENLFAPAPDPAKVSPERDRGELCQDRPGPVVQGDLIQLLAKDELDPKEDDEVEHGVDNGAGPDREEEEESGVRLGYSGEGTGVLDHPTSETKEGGRDEEWKKLGDQKELFGEISAVEKVLGFARQVELCVDLADGEKGAGNGAEEEGSTTHPDVEQQEKLKWGLCCNFEICHL